MGLSVQLSHLDNCGVPRRTLAGSRQSLTFALTKGQYLNGDFVPVCALKVRRHLPIRMISEVPPHLKVRKHAASREADLLIPFPSAKFVSIRRVHYITALSPAILSVIKAIFQRLDRKYPLI